MSRPTYTERRRAQLALRIASLEAMEPRSLITESLGILTAGIGLPAALVAGRLEAANSVPVSASKQRHPSIVEGLAAWPAVSSTGRGPGTVMDLGTTASIAMPGNVVPPTAANLIPKANGITLTPIVAPGGSSKGSGAGGSSHGGSGSVSPASTTAPPVIAAPSTDNAVSGVSASGSAISLSPGATPSPAPKNALLPSNTSLSPAPGSTPSHSATALHGSSDGTIALTKSTPPGSQPHYVFGGGGFVAGFELYTLDYNAGSLLLPGADRLATLGGNVDLRAQVSNTPDASYSWNTSGLTDATAISGASTYDLTFQWDSSVATATTNSVTLTTTNSLSETQVQTYTFQVPAGTGTAGTGTATWPESVAPDTVGQGAPSFAAHDVSVDANSGSLNTAISLPSYNPNDPPVILAYDSVTAYPQPIIIENHTLDPAQAVPSQVSAQLTFNGTAGSTYYYDTSGLTPGNSSLTPGDIQQIALQSVTSPSTGRYSYSIALGDIRSTTTTATVTGSATVINNSGSAFGSGWTLSGLERVVAATGGVILDLGSGGKSLWFATGSGSTYVDPAGEFSTLVANSGGTYTRTLTNGTSIRFDSSGREVADVDTNGVAITYAYDGSGRLSTIKDHYSNTTTFTYDPTSGLLTTISDPSGRTATFAHSGSDLSGVTLPDASTWGYAYDGSGRMNGVTDPDSNVVGVQYDSAERVGEIDNPDGSYDVVVADQETGFVPYGSGTSSSPSDASLLANSFSRYDQVNSSIVHPVGLETDLVSDWQGLGLTNLAADPLGNISTVDRDGNGLATIAVDQLNRISQFQYDSKRNVTKTIYPDGTSTSATYNSLAEPLTTTDELSRTTTSTYDSNGNLTGRVDPLGVHATMTYTGTGQVTSNSNPSGYVGSLGGATQGGGPVSFTYDSQDRELTRTDALDDTTTFTYDSAGNLASVKDGNGHLTTATYDPMGRPLSTTDALGHTTTGVYDASGNRTVIVDPLGHRTTTAFDVMNRAVSVTDSLGGITTYTYDDYGRQTSITDSVGNVTTYGYDADSRQVGSTDPNGYRTTMIYDADGEVTQRVDRDGRQMNFGYDPRGREVTESWISGTVTLETVTYTYDGAGEETQVNDGTTSLTYTYDNDGRQTGEGTSGSSGQPAVALAVGYYDSNARAALSDNLSSAGVVSYSYDAAFRLQFLAATDGTAHLLVTFGYDAGDRLISLTRSPTQPGSSSSATTVNTSYAYDAADRLTGISDSSYSDDDGNLALASYTYGYDNANRLTSETNAEGSVTYTYNNIDELTGVSGARSETYTYDHNGNRTMSGYSTGTNNETTAGAGYTYTYDHEGNLTAKTQTSTGNTWAYTWDYRNRLTGVLEKNSSNVVIANGTYTYDALDRRIGVDETISGTETRTWTVYDGANPYADFNGSGTLLERYLYGPGANQILARTSSSGTTAWYLADHEGTIRDIVNTSGMVLDHIAYDSYGNVTSESSASNGDRFKFDGMALDTTTALYQDNARYFNPTIGTFVSQDPTGFQSHDTNLYRFTNNSPTDFVDTTGDWSWGAAIGGFVGGTIIATGVIIFAPVTVPVSIGVTIVTVVGVGTASGVVSGIIVSPKLPPSYQVSAGVGIGILTAVVFTIPGVFIVSRFIA